MHKILNIQLEQTTHKKILKTYLQGEFNYKKNKGTSSMCLVYHPSGQIIIQDSN